MVKRYLGAVLVAFVLGCVGPLTVGAAQATEEPDDAPSLLGSVTDTVGGLTSGDEDAGSDVDAPEPAPSGPESGDAEPAAPGPGAQEPAVPGPGIAPAPDADGAVGSGGPSGTGVLGTVTTTVNRLADTPRSLLTGVVDGETPTPDVPVRPDVPTPDTPEPPADTPAAPDEPEKPGEPSQPGHPEAPETPGKPETPGNPQVDTPAGPPANAALALPDVNENVTEPEQTEPAPAQQPITQPDTAEPDRTESQRPRQDVSAFIDPTDSTGDNAVEQEKPAARPPQDIRAETISLRQVTQTPFVLAIALLTAVGVVTVRRVIAVK